MEAAIEGVGVFSAMELVDIRRETVYTAGIGLMPLEIGEPLFHAVVDMADGHRLRAACGQERRRLSPTFWRWGDATHDGRARCPACVRLHPLAFG